jgi:hypothetical protein
MPDSSNRLKSALGKWPGLFARLALTFHLIEVADARAKGERPITDVVQADTAKRAAAYMRDVLLPHLLRADAIMFATVQTGHARWIAGFILAKQLGGSPFETWFRRMEPFARRNAARNCET